MTEAMSFKLSSPLEYSLDGGFSESYELTLNAPSIKDRKQAASLLQTITRAQKSFAQGLNFTQEDVEKAKAEEQKEMTVQEEAEALRMMILASSEDLESFYEQFTTLLKRVCFVDTNVPIKDAHIEKLSLKDFDKMCFEYCANFIE